MPERAKDGRRTPQMDFESAEDIEKRLDEQMEARNRREAMNNITDWGVLLIFGVGILVGVYSTAWFGTWPAKLVGGTAIAAVTVSSIAILLNGIKVVRNV